MASTPQDNQALQQFYRDRLSSLDQEQQLVESQRRRLRLFFLFCAAAALFLGFHTFQPPLPNWLVFLPIATFVAAIPFSLRLRAKLLRIQRLQIFHNTNLARADGTRTQSGHTGDSFHDPKHLYDRDLNILGPDSLFGLLATVRTGIGQRGLAKILLEHSTPDEILERQRCIQELAPLTTLREQISLLGPSRSHDIPAGLFDAWLDEPPPIFHPAIIWTLAATTTALIVLLLLCALRYVTWSALWPNLAVVLALQATVALKARSRALPILNESRFNNQIQLFADSLALFEQQSFTSPRLRVLQQLCREPISASRALHRIQNQFAIIEQRNQQYFFILSLLLAAGTHAAIAIANWKRAYAPAMKQWLAAWAEFEALSALANYAFEHPQDIYPMLDPSSTVFHATGLGHPLLPEETCIRNDISLDASTRFYLISGSNMAGKSTLLRAIGLNAVLAYAGAPVRASSLLLSPLALGASLALTDSLAEGKSKFLAEVQRLRNILDLSKHSPALFLIDEVFSGTNSRDRCLSAEAVLRSLLQNRAIGALSTHDLALTALATEQNHGVNVHMASPDPDNPLAFDFLLKPGINPSSNAAAILRMMDIEP